MQLCVWVDREVRSCSTELREGRKIYCKWERYVRKLVKREVKYISIPRSGS